MNFFSKTASSIGAAAAIAISAMASSASAQSIVSYTLSDVPASGFGAWNYDADTLNDGIFPGGVSDNLLLDLTRPASITFVLDNSYFLSKIDIFGGSNDGNFIPGSIFSALVTIGANSATVFTSGFGAVNPSNGFNFDQSLALPGLLSSISTNTFTLSNFVSIGDSAGSYASLGEVQVSGSLSGPVPEPATWALMIGGFGLAGMVLRRRRAVVAA